MGLCMVASLLCIASWIIQCICVLQRSSRRTIGVLRASWKILYANTCMSFFYSTLYRFVAVFSNIERAVLCEIFKGTAYLRLINSSLLIKTRIPATKNHHQESPCRVKASLAVQQKDRPNLFVMINNARIV